jgi:hypothetical protein
MKKINCYVALVGFYQIKNSYSGASEVSTSLFNSIKCKKKKFFEIRNSHVDFKFEKINYIFNSIFFKPLKIIFLIFKIYNFLKKDRNRLVIIEGCSWIGYSFFLLKILKILFKNIKIIYHGHNIEYEIRLLKNNKIISLLTKFLEKKVYAQSDYATVVSKYDQKKIKKLYNLDSIILKNGVSKSRLKIKRINNFKKKKYIIFSGNYFYLPNQIAIKILLYKILPKINEKFTDIKLVITGTNLPKYIANNNKIIFMPKLEKSKLNYIIKKSICTILPLINSPGTKLKVIESLMLGNPIIASSHSFKGIEIKSMNPPFIFKKKSDINAILNKLINNSFYKRKSYIDSYFYKKEYQMENIVNKFFSQRHKAIDFKK